MRKIVWILIIGLLSFACQRRIQPPRTRYTPVNVGTVPNDGTGDPIRAAFQKVNAGFVDVYDSLGNIYTEAQTQAVIHDSLSTLYSKAQTSAIINDTIEARLTSATDISSIAWLKADSNTHGNPATVDYVDNAVGSGSGTGFDVDKVEFIVGTTAGAPSDADTSFTIAQLASKDIKLYRGTTADLHPQYPNRTATNGVTGYRYNSSGVIVVRPAWATGDRAYIEGIPTANTNWLTLSSAAAYFTETFEASGYDNAVWSETVGSGSFVDEDETGVTPDEDGTKTLQITKESPNFNAASVATLGVNQVVSYLTFYVYVNAHGLASGELMSFYSSWLDGYADNISAISLYVDSYDSNNLKFVFEINDDGVGTTSVAWPAAGSAIALDAWYKINIKYDVTGDTYEAKITPSGGSEASVMSGSLTATHPTAGLRLIKLGNTGDSETCNIYFDNVAVGTAVYPTF